MYTGNPVVHDLGALLYRPVLVRALASKSLFNSSAIDTLPKIVQTGLMFGRQFPTGVPVPDIDRTQYLLIIGANPVVSHGSLMTMPDAPGRLKAVLERGGKVVVIDPRRTRRRRSRASITSSGRGATPRSCSRWSTRCSSEGLVELGAAAGLVNGLDAVEAIAREFAPEARRRALRHRRRQDPAPRARARRGRVGRVLRPTRHLRAGVRHARELGLRSRQHPHRQSRSSGRRDVHDARRAGRRGAAERQGLRARALEEPRERAARGGRA